MKGHLSAGPAIFDIEIKGESWIQGQTVQGILTVKNLTDEDLELDDIGVILSLGDFKKVHSHTAGSLKEIRQLTFTKGEFVAPNKTVQLSFEFHLDSNCPITDKKESFFICYGHPDRFSHLQLVIHPLPQFKQISECVDRFFRFKFIEAKGSSKGTVFKFKPPSSREYANVDYLELTLKLDQQDLLLNFLFQKKKLGPSPARVTTVITKEKENYSYQLTPREYSLTADAINQDKIISLMEEVMGKVKLKIL